MADSRKAPLSIDFAIVGGSIAGLACAYSLASAGHRVRVFEKLAGRPTDSAGIRVPPNLDRPLREWGLGAKLDFHAHKTARTDCFHLEDNSHQGFVLWHSDILHESGGVFCTMRWDALYDMLFELATSAGATVTYGAHTVGLAPGTEKNQKPTLAFADGSTYTADVVVGADGVNSTIRGLVTDHLGPRAGSFEPEAMTAYSVILNTKKLMADDEQDYRSVLFEKAVDTSVWTSDKRWIMAFPIARGEEYSVTLYCHDEFASKENDSPEGFDYVPTSSLDYTGFDPIAIRSFSLAEKVMRVSYTNTLVEEWVDPDSRILLVGDAAHPSLPLSIHGQSMAVEDAIALGTLFSRLMRRDQIAQLLDGFQEIRYERCKFVHFSELATVRNVSLPEGEEREIRDINLRRASLERNDETEDEATLLSQWEAIGSVFGHSARDAADEWWIKWGTLDQRTSVFDAVKVGMGMQVQEVTQSS